MISVIIPAYNEEKIIGKTINDIKRFFLNKNIKNEIIVVNDHSSDGTLDISKKGGAVILSNKQNKGQSYSVIRGISESKHNKILTVDADNEIPLANIEDYLKIKRKSFIIGKRENIPRKSERFLSYFTRNLINVNDPFCYLKLFDKRDLKGIEKIGRKEIYSFQLVELAVLNGLKIKNIPVKGIKRREDTKYSNNFKIWSKIFKCVIKTLRLSRGAKT